MTVATSVLPGQLAPLHEVLRAKRHDLITVEHLSAFVHYDEPVRIAVKSEADIRPRLPDLGGHSFGIQRAATVVDVQAVGFGTYLDDLGAQFLKCKRRDLVIRPVGAVNDHTQTVKRQMGGERILEIDNITARRILDLVGASGLGPAQDNPTRDSDPAPCLSCDPRPRPES